jgi:hypothetical protein
LEEQVMSASTAAVVVQQQLDAYNRRDIEALIATYAEDAQQFEHPDTLLASGAAQIKERLRARFQEPNLHAQLLDRIVMGHLVIDHERVARTFPEGTGTIELVATYEVVQGRITRHWVAFGEKVLDA